MSFPNLIAAFEHVATAGGYPLAKQLEHLSELTSMKIDHAVFSRWRNGKRTPPPAALSYMAEMAVDAVLSAEGIDTMFMTSEALDRIAAGLTPPARVASV